MMIVFHSPVLARLLLNKWNESSVHLIIIKEYHNCVFCHDMS